MTPYRARNPCPSRPYPCERETAEPAFRQLGGRRGLRDAGKWPGNRRRGGWGPVALRPRLSPSVPLSSDRSSIARWLGR